MFQIFRGTVNLNSFSGLVTINADLKDALVNGQKLPAAEIYAKVETKIGLKLLGKGNTFLGTPLFMV